MNVANERLLTKSEVAALLNVSERTVDRMISAGKIRTVRAGDRVRFRQQDVDDYLAGETKQPDDV